MNGQSQAFSFLCDCKENAIIWVNRFTVTPEGTILLSGVCMSCGKVYNGLAIKQEDIAELIADAERNKGNTNPLLN